MNYYIELTIREAVEEFVIQELNGRYHEWISDKCLIAVLMSRLGEPIYGCPTMSRGEILFKEDDEDVLCWTSSDSILYEASCLIFESILEDQCHAGGNGHHVAQNFIAFINSKLNGMTIEQATQRGKNIENS